MSKLILIKHARPTVMPDLPPEEWPLSEEGRKSCEALAEKLREHAPELIYSSDEMKARETAQRVAEALGIDLHVHEGLREHDRTDVPQMQTREFISYMALLFKKPGELVLGNESADEAQGRFADAVTEIEAKHPDQSIAIVSHGTVIALYAGQLLSEDPFQIWRRMQLPSFLVLENSRLTDRLDRLE